MELNNPPIQNALPVEAQGATWTKPWANFFTQIFQGLAYGWQWKSKTVTADYTVAVGDSVILLNADATVFLPTLRDAGPKRITVKVINGGCGTRTVDGNGANIDGASSVTTTSQYMSWDFVNDSTQWYVV